MRSGKRQMKSLPESGKADMLCGDPVRNLCEHPFNDMPRLLFRCCRTGCMTATIPIRLFKADEKPPFSGSVNLESCRVFQIQGLLVIVVDPQPRG